MQVGGSEEAIALLESIVGATPIGTTSVLASLYEQCGRAEDAASLRDRELFSGLGEVMGSISRKSTQGARECAP